MKIELSSRDIELILLLLQESVSDKLDTNNPDALSLEEFALMERLENALRNIEASEQDILDIKSGTVYH